VTALEEGLSGYGAEKNVSKRGILRAKELISPVDRRWCCLSVIPQIPLFFKTCELESKRRQRSRIIKPHGVILNH